MCEVIWEALTVKEEVIPSLLYVVSEWVYAISVPEIV